MENRLDSMWLMILSCGAAFLLVIILPYFGFSSNWSLGIAMGVMIGLHVLMMKNHGHVHNSSQKQKGGSCH